jgi:hypothetical protein
VVHFEFGLQLDPGSKNDPQKRKEKEKFYSFFSSLERLLLELESHS